jgi:5-methylcytosine-specific restriction protein A
MQDFAKQLYESKAWRKLRKEILISDKYECQVCKAKGFYIKANTVHHINYIKLHPELALDKFYKDDDGNVKRNLISLCHLCHEHIHEWLQKEKEEPLTVEQW